ncbi:polymorphic toxin-type HINT domain-containing protein [Streptomyces sp. NPDC001678]|uniref:polymorphic toxin-type HINT domain-containing protein n=1 Tax=Streptomyces sp. NPDC001678 TaxID=3364599 RepID=UPI0036AA1320
MAGSELQPLNRARPVAAADESSGGYDLSNAAQVREDQCRLDYVLRKGGANMKAVARAGLAGSEAELHTAANPQYWQTTPLSGAFEKDRDWSAAKVGELSGRNPVWQEILEVPQGGWTPGYKSWPPGSPGDKEENIFAQTGFRDWIYGRFWTSQSDFYDPLPQPANKESVDAVTKIATTRYSKDRIEDQADWKAWEWEMRLTHPMYADDARIFLQNGGFPTSAPDPSSMEFRIDVENLKARFASCVSHNPPDPHNVLGTELTTASLEWQAELSSQKAQRGIILRAEAEANADLIVASQALGEALGQSMIASRLSHWMAYWVHPDPDQPWHVSQADMDLVKGRMAQAQARATGRLYVASRAALHAQAQADKVTVAQQDAYAIADRAKVPRGRGLMYGQQAAQIAKASAAAAQAAAKATETASNATRASAADSKTLDALAMTQAHAAKAAFRRIAAQEAAAQAKAAAEGAAAQAVEAAQNASKAKAAQVRAEAAEKTAKTAAEDAASKRVTAETERDKAKEQREIAAAEQAKAATADKEAQSQRAVAASKLSETQAARKTALEKKDAAVAAEGKAASARDKALQAESNRDVLSAKADALEAKAEADDSSDAAGASRAAATRARTAANEATTAATNARAAADEATTAAANAREAATKAGAAAARSKAASDAAQRDVVITNAAVQKAHAAAADAIVASEAAAQNVRTAKALADTAQAKANEAKADAGIARTEANAAAATSIQAAGFAYATAQASLAARDSAAQVVKPANDAIELGAPYKEIDSSAGLAVLTGQAAKTAAEQQQSVARAKAEQAAKAAAEAATLAARADADAKAAATSAAQAADSASQAATSLARAQTSADEAVAAAKAAKRAEANTVEYDRRATEDAAVALSASTEAGGYASDARSSADQAEQNASSARSAASAAEGDASAARGVADQAERDATTAEKAAARAQQDAKEAQEAATRAEDQEARRAVDTGGATGIAHMFTKQEVVPLEDPKPENDCVLGMGNSGCDVKFRLRFKLTVDFYLCNDANASENVTAATCPAASILWLGRDTSERTTYVTKHFSNWDVTKIVDKAFLIGLWDGLTHDFVECSRGSVSGCAWAASWFVPPAKIVEAVDLFRALDASLRTGVGVGDAYKALKALGLDAEVIATVEREANMAEDVLTTCTRNSFPGSTRVLMADGSHRPIRSLRVGDVVLATDPETGERRAEPVTAAFKHDTERLVDISFTGGSSLTSTAGHRVYTVEHGWTLVSELRTGDRLRGPDGALHAVSDLRDRSGLAPELVFDLTVDQFHTFYVSTEGARPQDVLVHNCLNLSDETAMPSSGAHTLSKHVNVTPTEAARIAGGTGKPNGVWSSAEIAQQAVDRVVSDYFYPYKPGRGRALDTARWNKFLNWRKTAGTNDYFPIEGSWDAYPSLGKTYHPDGSVTTAGNGVTVLLKKWPHKGRGGFLVYTAYPN